MPDLNDARDTKDSKDTKGPKDAKDSKRSLSANPPGCSSPAPIPANLHACIESRQHALATRYSHTLSFARSPGRVILDPLSDVVYFPPRRGYMAASAQFHTCMSLCSPADLRRVRRLALHEDLFSSSVYSSCCAPWYWSGLAVALTVECLRLVRDRMPAVEEVIFVSSSGGCHGKDDDEVEFDHDEDDDAPARLVAQVQTAMRDLAATGDGAWEPPRWTVVTEPREP